MMRCAGHVSCRGEKRCAYRGLVEKMGGRRKLGRHRYRREGNIKRVFN